MLITPGYGPTSRSGYESRSVCFEIPYAARYKDRQKPCLARPLSPCRSLHAYVVKYLLRVAGWQARPWTEMGPHMHHAGLVRDIEYIQVPGPATAVATALVVVVIVVL